MLRIRKIIDWVGIILSIIVACVLIFLIVQTVRLYSSSDSTSNAAHNSIVTTLKWCSPIIFSTNNGFGNFLVRNLKVTIIFIDIIFAIMVFFFQHWARKTSRISFIFLAIFSIAIFLFINVWFGIAGVVIAILKFLLPSQKRLLNHQVKHKDHKIKKLQQQQDNKSQNS